MTRSVTRRTLAGCMALAALSALVLDVVATTAEAAPCTSPFVGSYVGADPRGQYSSWAVRISKRGSVRSSYRGKHYKRSLRGRISDDGSYTFAVSEAYFEPGPREHGWHRWGYESTGTLGSDVDGNLVGTEGTGSSFSWLRR